MNLHIVTIFVLILAIASGLWHYIKMEQRKTMDLGWEMLRHTQEEKEKWK